MKRTIITIIILLAVSLLGAADKTVVSVLYFSNNTGKQEYEWMSKGVADMLISDLSLSNEITVVERQDIEKLIKEKEFSDLGLTNGNSSKKAALFLKADILISGSYYVENGFLRFDVKLTDIRTSEINSFSLKMNVKNFSDLEKKTAFEIYSILKLKTPISLKADTESFYAAKEFYEGLDMLDSGKYVEAITKFNNASDIDPLYSKVSKEMQRAYSFLSDFRKARYHREMASLYDKANIIIKRMNEDPFLSYVQVMNRENYSSMSAEERKEFTKRNSVYLMYSSKSQCALSLQGVLLEIINKRNSFIDETFDRLDDAVEKKIDKLKSEKRLKINEIAEDQKKSRNEYYKKRDEAKKIEDKNERNEKLKQLTDQFQKERLDYISKKTKVDKEYRKKIEVLNNEKKEIEQERQKEIKKAEKKNDILYKKIVSIAAAAEREFAADDKFLPGIMYYRLLVYLYVKDYDKLKLYSRRFMETYPEYRMIEHVENFYETAVEKSM